jgi:nitrite reductase/ring-hydroxylating ferredoxin subunit
MPHIDLPYIEMAPGTLTRIEHEGKNIVLARTESDIFAYVDVCPHAFWPLSAGTLRGDVLECPGHGWEFDVRTGRCLNTPDKCLTPVSVDLQVSSIRLRWVEDRKPAGGLCSLKSPAASMDHDR